MKTNGQYGIQNPLFMYQGTMGISFSNTLKNSFKTEPHLAELTRSGLYDSPLSDKVKKDSTLGMSLPDGDIHTEYSTQVVSYAAALSETGVLRCGMQ